MTHLNADENITFLGEVIVWIVLYNTSHHLALFVNGALAYTHCGVFSFIGSAQIKEKEKEKRFLSRCTNTATEYWYLHTLPQASHKCQSSLACLFTNHLSQICHKVSSLSVFLVLLFNIVVSKQCQTVYMLLFFFLRLVSSDQFHKAGRPELPR